MRYNLLDAKRFIFPSFNFNDLLYEVNVTEGDISWVLLHKVHERDEELHANLRKAPKLIAKTLNPGDNKQDVQRSLNIFHATTCAAIEENFPAEKSSSEFLK